jgi:hypothetical protein
MSFEERQKLGQNIQKLSPKNMKGIVKIIHDNASQKEQKTIEFDLNMLDDVKVRQLEDYVLACLKQQA